MKNVKSKLLYEALVSSCLAEEAEAKATLVVYFENASGIGEHPQVVEEMKKQLDKATNAKDKRLYLLEEIKRHIEE